MLPKNRVLTPGPTALLPEAQIAQAEAAMHHRTDAFIELFQTVRKGLQQLFKTERPVLTFASSGSGGLEACVANLIQEGDKVICVNAGKFGERWMKMNQAFGANVIEVKVEHGRGVPLAAVAAQLGMHPDVRAVFVQGSESSTGAVHPVQQIAQLVKPMSNCLMCVDAITWIGAHEVRTDEWNLDLVVCGSQKAMAMPPGLAFVSVSEKAEKMLGERKGNRRFYFDFARELKNQAKDQTAFTPAISLIAAAAASLKWILDAGVDSLTRNAFELASMSRAAVQAMGLELLSDSPSESVTAVRVPGGMDSGAVIKGLKNQFGAIIANGQDDLKGKIFRLAHLGYYDYIDTMGLIAALEVVLAEAGLKFESGAGLKAAQAEYMKLKA
ncbi:MAG: alanine--glyoxylate aminotransferase family protein [Planctomycetes bacterium]|nr:alanine--glyoxylate aminotransferase family protein [Planctomycetota bacterium]